MRCSKGTEVASVRSLVRAAGKEDALVARLGPEEVEAYRDTLAVAWVPVDFVARLFELAAAELYVGEARPLRQLGRAIARDNLTGIYRVMLRIVSVPFAIERAAALWHTYNDTGAVKTERQGDRLLMTVSKYPAFPETALEECAGYTEGLMLMCGARNIDVKTSRPRDDAFVFDCSWRA
jgi:hypothetical protein